MINFKPFTLDQDAIGRLLDEWGVPRNQVTVGFDEKLAQKNGIHHEDKRAVGGSTHQDGGPGRTGGHIDVWINPDLHQLEQNDLRPGEILSGRTTHGPNQIVLHELSHVYQYTHWNEGLQFMSMVAQMLGDYTNDPAEIDADEHALALEKQGWKVVKDA